MSKNASNKRRAKAWQRDQFTRFPRGVSMSWMLTAIGPISTPFLDYITRRG